MRRSVIVAVLIVIALAAVGAYLLGRHRTAAPTSPPNTYSMNMPSSTGASAAPVSTNAVTIQNFAFSPADITVKQGTTVTWTNRDNAAHTVSETDSLSGPKSSALDFSASYSFTFSQPGTYHYHCSIHPQMTGTVTVTS